MLFYLTTLNLVKFLYEETPNLLDNKSNPTVMVVIDAWNYCYFVCMNYILNLLDNTFYDVYYLIKSVKVL
jgi:hypothetical protein